MRVGCWYSLARGKTNLRAPPYNNKYQQGWTLTLFLIGCGAVSHSSKCPFMLGLVAPTTNPGYYVPIKEVRQRKNTRNTENMKFIYGFLGDALYTTRQHPKDASNQDDGLQPFRNRKHGKESLKPYPSLWHTLKHP